MSRFPFTRNPLLSLWLSAANRAMGTAAGHGLAAARRQQARAARLAAGAFTGRTPKAKRRRGGRND